MFARPGVSSIGPGDGPRPSDRSPSKSPMKPGESSRGTLPARGTPSRVGWRDRHGEYCGRLTDPMGIKNRLKDYLPPAVLSGYRRVRGRALRFEGPYGNWAQARLASKGYDDES